MLQKPIDIEKSSRHQKIIGALGENMVCNWLSRSGFEVSIVDHTGIDVIAYNPRRARAQVCFEHIAVNTETGEGICLGTWMIVIGDNTLSGSANGKIMGGLSGSSEGYFRGTHGTGEFEHIQKMGTYSVNLATGILEAEGVIIYH